MANRSRLTLTALTLVAAGAFAPMAQASGFQLREQSQSAQGNAFAGISAGGSDISALFFNPAIMTQYDGSQFSFGATYIGIKAEFADATATRTPALIGLGFNSTPTGGSTNVISGSPTHPNAAISAGIPEFNVMYSLNKDWKLGFSLNVPFGLTTEYNGDFIGRYHALKSDLKTYDFAPSIAYRANDVFSFGVAFIARRADAELSSGVDFGTALALKVGPALAAAGLSTVSPGPGQNSPVAVLAMAPPNGTLGTPGYAIPGGWDGKAGLKGGGWGYGFKAGGTIQASPDFRIGFSYVGAMSMTLKGDATFEYPTSMPVTDLGALQGAGLRNGTGSAVLDLPATASIGFDYKVSPDFSLQAEVSQSTWSRFKELRIKFNTGAPDSVTDESWNNTLFTSIGATWKMNRDWTFRGGLAFDKSAVDDAHRTPRIPDNDRKWVSLGCSYAFSKKAILDFAYTKIFVSDGKVMLTAANDNITRGNLNGKIQADINILSAGFHYSF